VEIDVVELGGTALELGEHFEHHVVLVRLRVHRVDLALAERVVERVLDRRRRDADRDADTRSIVSAVASPPAADRWRRRRARAGASRSTNFAVHTFSSSGFGSSRTYWYCVRLMRSSTVMFWTGCMYSVMPSTSRASAGPSRRITSAALAPRSARGLRLIENLPLFVVVFVPSTPMNDDRLATAGSRRMTRASAC
jgi:hypothetical protein